MEWRRTGHILVAPVALHRAWEPVATSYVAHRLRALHARPHDFVQPRRATVDGGRLVLEFAAGALDEPPVRVAGDHAWWRLALPCLEVMARCHAAGLAGLGPLLGAAWTPPVGWFLPGIAGEHFDARKRADVKLVAGWLEGVDRVPPGVWSALRGGDTVRLLAILAAEAHQRRVDEIESPPPPSFLSLLTEAELLERVGTLYRYRRVDEPGEVVREVVIELDRQWRDPHFDIPDRPSPQELWDELTEDTRVTPTLAVTSWLPNPLQPSLQGGIAVRWLGVHADQPLVYVDPGNEDLPASGYVRPFAAGDNTLLKRKRLFTAFAGEHHALRALLAAAPPRRAFHRNTWRRDTLEDAILDTAGLFAVQGPPGTGKTHLATEVVRRLLSRTPHARVLVCAKEHFALEHIQKKITTALASDGVPVRCWRSLSLAKRRRDRGNIDPRWLPAAVVADLSARTFTPASAEWAAWARRGVAPHDQRLATLGRLSAELFFATTTDASMVDALGKDAWDLVIVEEAGKCYPSELLHALALGRSALMIGDHQQLPPFQERRTREAVDAWTASLGRAGREPRHAEELRARLGPLYASLDALRRSRGRLSEEERGWVRPFEFLFERLDARHRLEEQFRMEAPLSRLIGSVFYDRPFDHRKGELVARGLVPSRPLDECLPSFLDAPLLWIDTPHVTVSPGATEDAQKRGVRDNQHEVDLVVAYLRRLRPSQSLDLVILTPYNAQKALLLGSEALRVACARLTSRPLDALVRTTDEYQGRESELVILSLVRNNTLGQRAWGFMAEKERLNVMLSRARFRLVVVGCTAHIGRHADDNPWLGRVLDAWRREAHDPAAARFLAASEVARG